MYEGDSGTYDSIKITYDLSKAMGGYGFVRKNFTTKRYRARYNKLQSSPWHPKPETKPLPTGEKALDAARSIEKDIHRIIDSIDDMGRWTEDGRLYSDRFYYKNRPEYGGPVMKNGWIRTRTFIRNMQTLSRYVKLVKNSSRP